MLLRRKILEYLRDNDSVGCYRLTIDVFRRLGIYLSSDEIVECYNLKIRPILQKLKRNNIIEIVDCGVHGPVINVLDKDALNRLLEKYSTANKNNSTTINIASSSNEEVEDVVKQLLEVSLEAKVYTYIAPVHGEKLTVLAFTSKGIFEVVINPKRGRVERHIQLTEFFDIERYVTPEGDVYYKINGSIVHSSEVWDFLVKNGLVVWKSTRVYEGPVQTLINKLPVRTIRAFECPGVYPSDNGELILAILQTGAHICAVKPHAVQIVKCISRISLPESKKVIESIVELAEYQVNKYRYYFEIGFGIGSSFSYAFKLMYNVETPVILNQGPKGRGKTTLGKLITEKGFGVPGLGADSIRTEYRFSATVDSTTFPILVDDISSDILNSISSLFKSYTGSIRLTFRGHGLKRELTYYARAPIIFTSNNITISDPALRDRILIVNFNISDTISNSEVVEFRKSTQRFQMVGLSQY